MRTSGCVRLIGWTSAPEIRVRWPDGSVTVKPSIQRADVARQAGLPLESGFEIEIPEAARPLKLDVPTSSGETVTLPVRHPSEPPTAAAERRIRRAFVRDLLRAFPSGVKWMVKRDDASRTAVKRALGLEDLHPGLPMEDRYLHSERTTAQGQPQHPFASGSGGLPINVPSSTPLTIIMPVHNAYDMLTEALGRVARNTDLDWHMVLVDDASSDERVRPFLREWSQTQEAGRVLLIELDTNLGFVGAVNRAFSEAEHLPGHLVLLNSDAMVPPNWASRLIAPFFQDDRIASVTPMSNDAEIFSMPLIVQSRQLPEGMVDKLDAIAASMSPPPRLPSAPTGVGFCMALSSHWFARVSRFDAAFGRGYGEEVDWCQKIRKLGGRHVGLPTLFVEHRGGQSFGPNAKRDLVLRANAMIARRFPAYDLEVQSYIGRDPLRTPRLALAVAHAGFTSTGRLPLFLAHSLGGGAEHALEEEIAHRTRLGLSALVLRVGGSARFQVEVHTADGVIAATTGNFETVRRLLAPVPELQIVYSCGVGYPDPATLPQILRGLRRPDCNDGLSARVHDFFMLSPSYNMLGSDGCYRGAVPDASDDPAHSIEDGKGRLVTLRDWRRNWRAFLEECDEITVFSESSAHLLRSAFPDLRDDVLICRPHRISPTVGRIEHPKINSMTIGVLGNINRAKGAALLCDLGERFAKRGAAQDLILIGNMDPAFSLPSSVKLHGSYRVDEIAMLAERYGIGRWLVPSIWPETFSFVTHEVIATGLPVFGFDIGAQGEALQAAPNGYPIAFDPDADLAGAVLEAMARFDSARAA